MMTMTRRGNLGFALARRHPFIILIFLVVCTPLQGTLVAQEKPSSQDEKPDVIKVRTDLLQLRAVVSDKHGKPVTGLKQEDFEIIESGRVETPAFFSEAQIRSVNAPEPVTTHTQVPGEPVPGSRENARPVRTIVLFVDTLHLSNVSLLRAKQQLRQFVDEYVTD